MTANQAVAITQQAISSGLRDFLNGKTKITPDIDQDLFATGLITSLFALELIVYLEKVYDIEINGVDLKLNNFRTIDTMTSLVRRILAQGHDE